MTLDINPVDIYFYTHTINNAEAVYKKYEHLAELLDIDIQTSFKRGIAAIITKKDFTFHRMLQRIAYSFESDFDSIIEQISKILGYHLEGKYVDISSNEMEITINDLTFNVEDYTQIIPDQELTIEFLLLTVFSYRAEETNKIISKTSDKFKDQEYFNVDEAAEFTEYKKSYIYKLHAEGKLKGGQNKPGGKLRFKRKSLIDIMFRYSN